MQSIIQKDSIQQLLMYAFVGIPLTCLLLPSLFWINKRKGVMFAWIHLDRVLCSLVHNTEYRTISGYTGEHIGVNLRWRLQCTVIDKLAKWCGDGDNHCYRTFLCESERGLK